MEKNNRALKFAFWVIVCASLGFIAYKFFGSLDQPMEWKILAVFVTFTACAGIFRWIRKKSTDDQLNRWVAEAIEWSDTGISAVALAFVIMAFILQAFKIPSGSMQPTLLIGDHLFVNKFIYGSQMPFTSKRLWHLKDVKRFDVIVFLCPPQALSEEDRKNDVKKDFIKRAIGLPGDTIEIRNKVLYINGEKAGDPHGTFVHPSVYPRINLFKAKEEYQTRWEKGEFVFLQTEWVRDNFGPVKVPPKSFFVLGDNRDGSFDSRFWGPLSEEYLKGRAWIIYWPLTRFKVIR